MGCDIILAPVGGGKTAVASLTVKELLENKIISRIYGNFHLNLNNFIYTPYLIIPLSECDNSAIIGDDFYYLEIAKRFAGIIVNRSRKQDLFIYLTGQDYIMFPRMVRDLSRIIIPHVNKAKTTIILDIFTRKFFSIEMLYGGKPEYKHHQKIIKNFVPKLKGSNPKYMKGKLYNTYEVVAEAYEEVIIPEISRLCKKPKDINSMLYCFFGNKQTRQRIKKEFFPDLITTKKENEEFKEITKMITISDKKDNEKPLSPSEVLYYLRIMRCKQCTNHDIKCSIKLEHGCPED